MSDAISLEEALRIVTSAAPPLPAERIPLGAALGRALAGEALARIDQPPFDKSAMDGFAHGSVPPAPEGPWEVVGLAAARASAAGDMPPKLGNGECVRIMTGAAIPEGAAAVQRVEWTEALPGSGPGRELVRFTRAERTDNIIRRGENQREGERLLSPRVLSAQDLGILASSGYGEILARARPRVAVISTGDELTQAGAALTPGAIYDSNGPLLAAQAEACGCDARFLGVVRDDEAALTAAFAEALPSCDLLLVSGGVSMGDFDHVPRALESAGVATRFHGVAMRPGKPLLFGTGAGACAGRSAFGMPGNPVSTFVGFEILVRPLLAALCGLPWAPRLVGARLAAAMERRETDRVEFRPARLEAGAGGLPAVRPLRYKGSSMLSALAEADCLVRMEVGVGRLEEGSVVDARLVRP
jgi:molybdopterin molybdotransferase